jgi:glycosyltransferase involved in cell wall biosynthesis
MIHPNFPGQFKLLARELAERNGWDIVGLGNGERPAQETKHLSYLHYNHPTGPAEAVFPMAQGQAEHARRGSTVADMLLSLKDKGYSPDVILAHPGWGDALFVREVFPDTRFIAYMEYYYRSRGSDIDFDPEFPVPQSDVRFASLRNSTNLQAFAEASQSITPTQFQASLFPDVIRSRLDIVHEGIDTQAIAPSPTASFRLSDGRVLSRSDEVVTYVSRSLEPYRGFHVFMRALPKLMRRRPKAQFVIVGREGVSYGRRHPSGKSWKAVLLEEVGRDLDLSRVYFVGNLGYGDYLDLLRISSAHLYLTYPFVLSWSFLEAMACGCAMVGSATAPVLEVLEDGVNGRTVGFFDRAALVETVNELLDDPPQRDKLARAARETVIERYDFRTRTFPKYLDLLKG